MKLQMTKLQITNWLLVLFAASVLVNSHAALFEWTPTPDTSGYRLYYGDSSHIYTNSIGVGRWDQTTNTITLPPGRYYFAMTPTNGLGEGPWSNEVQYTFTNTVKLLPVLVISTELQSAPTATGSWQVITNYQLQITNYQSSQFLRARLDVKTK
jgi:hypothetical protein